MKYITNISLKDGFGSQFQHIVSVILISFGNGWQFVYHPLTAMEHNYDNDPAFLEKIEELMNVRPFFPLKTDPSMQEINMTVCNMSAKYAVDRNINALATESNLNRIREMYWANKDRSAIYEKYKQYTNVAVHVRRPNSHDNRLKGSDTPDDFYLRAIQRVRDENKDVDRPLLFHIYSQGDMERFACFSSDDIVLHIDTDLCETFKDMVAADILVTSFSSMSYVAGFLNTGKIYFHPFWHKPRSCWVLLD